MPLKLLSWPTFYPVISPPALFIGFFLLTFFLLLGALFLFRYISPHFFLYTHPYVYFMHCFLLLLEVPWSLAIIYYAQLTPSSPPPHTHTKAFQKNIDSPCGFCSKYSGKKLEDFFHQQHCILFFLFWNPSLNSDDTIFSPAFNIVFDLKHSHLLSPFSLANHAVSHYF